MVLCITHSGDFYTIDIVQQALQQAGIPVIRFNTDEFGTRYRFSYTLQQGKPVYTVHTPNATINALQITGVWYRKLWELQVPPALDTAWQPIFKQEYNTYLQLFLQALHTVPWINKRQPAHIVCKNKLLQLTAAQEAGLAVPPSLFSNEPAAVREFYDHCQGAVIMKLHNPLARSMKGDAPFFPTTRLPQQDLALLETLVYCPMIFQQYISKLYELRVIYIAGVFYTGKIPVTYNQLTDWRTVSNERIAWEIYELPDAVKEKLQAMMQQLELSFGAIDMIRNTDGEYVFLEVNPFGEWGMLQKYLHYPIGETIAQNLVNQL